MGCLILMYLEISHISFGYLLISDLTMIRKHTLYDFNPLQLIKTCLITQQMV